MRQPRDGEIGQVEDFIVDDGNWKILYLEIDRRKWLPGKKVLVAPAWIERIDRAAREIVVDLEREMIESAPPYNDLPGHWPRRRSEALCTLR